MIHLVNFFLKIFNNRLFLHKKLKKNEKKLKFEGKKSKVFKDQRSNNNNNI